MNHPNFKEVMLMGERTFGTGLFDNCALLFFIILFLLLFWGRGYDRAFETNEVVE